MLLICSACDVASWSAFWASLAHELSSTQLVCFLCDVCLHQTCDFCQVVVAFAGLSLPLPLPGTFCIAKTALCLCIPVLPSCTSAEVILAVRAAQINQVD
jgi:hypothetical protein